MAEKPRTTSWMWQNEHGGVNGVMIDETEHQVLWFDDAVACACGTDSRNVQSFEQFRQRGAPLMGVPDDVMEALEHTINLLMVV